MSIYINLIINIIICENIAIVFTWFGIENILSLSFSFITLVLKSTATDYCVMLLYTSSEYFRDYQCVCVYIYNIKMSTQGGNIMINYIVKIYTIV